MHSHESQSPTTGFSTRDTARSGQGGIAVHPALLWLFIAAGVILLRLNRLVALTYFGVGVLAVVVRAIMTRRHSL
jgi:hypothetical protein